MEDFPKKYNYKSVTKNKTQKTDWIDLFSPCIPLDQKINPGSAFSIYFKDMYCKISELTWKILQTTTWYTVSSIYHSLVDTAENNQYKLQIPKKIKKNLSFINGLWIDLEPSYEDYTMTENFNRYIRNVFSDFFEHNKLKYEQNTILWNKSYQRNVIDTDISTKEMETPQFTIKYFIEAKWQTINVVTTRIETIFADVAIAVNPSDKRYKKLIGQNVIIPIINKSIPIIWDDAVDVFCGEGAIRVTPWHDKFGLELAKRHWLPTDIFAIDTDWKFTEHAWTFAWKDLSDFLDNIIKYVDDIWNMESRINIKGNKFFDKNTWEELFPMTLHQWSLNYDYSKDYLLNYMQNSEIWNIDQSKIDEKTKMSLSNRSSKWLLIPILTNHDGKIFAINDTKLIDIYESKKTRKDIVITLMILNLILDNYLPSTFTLQELIDALFSRNFLWDNTKIWEYIDIYTKLWEQKSSYKNGLKTLKKFIEWIERNTEKVESLIDILKESFAITVDNDNISINYHDLFWESWLELQYSDSFNKWFIDSCRVLYKLWCEYSDKTYSETTLEDRFFMSTYLEDDYFINILLLWLQYSKRLLFNKLIKHPCLIDSGWHIISNYNSKFLSKDFYENFNLYWADALRITTLFWDIDEENANNVIFNTYKSNEYLLLLNKIWNANRYVFSKYKEKYWWKCIKVKDILWYINSEWISDYDNWMLHNLKMVLDDFVYQISEQNYLSVWKKIINNYVSFFCDKYINITKITRNENTNELMFFIWAVFLKLLYPFIPNIVSEIQSKFNIDWQWLSIQDFKEIELNGKNYKINIFTEVVDKINLIKDQLGIKKHEFVDVVVQANPDLLTFLQENESIFRLLTKIQHISLIRPHEEMPNWYKVDNVINISVWIRKPDNISVEVKKDVLTELEWEYREKTEHLQHLKSLFASIYWNADSELMEKKRQEITNLQNDIEELEFKIWKLKMSN